MTEKLKVLSVALDEDDHDAVQRALSVRHGFRALPDGDSDRAGALLAEICRGWLEMLGRWPRRREP